VHKLDYVFVRVIDSELGKFHIDIIRTDDDGLEQIYGHMVVRRCQCQRAGKGRTPDLGIEPDPPSSYQRCFNFGHRWLSDYKASVISAIKCVSTGRFKA
jgi:hypothetical protein